jgi:peptide deformylase
MAIRDLHDNLVRARRRKVARVTRTTQTLIDDMIATMRANGRWPRPRWPSASV